MSKISQKRKRFEGRRKRKKRKKLGKLKEKYWATKSKSEKEKIIEKMRKISPRSPIEEILGIKKENKAE